MARRTLTDKGVATLAPRSTRYHHPDPELKGHYVRVLPTGTKVFAAVAIDPRGKQVWATIGNTSLMTIAEARTKARNAVTAIKAGEDRAGPQSFQAVADQWVKRHVESKGLRSRAAIERALANHILPAWGGREFTGIKRGDVAKLLDRVEDNAGPVAADFALSVVRSMCNWYAARHDDYASPIVKGMRRSNPVERARDRVLTDDELRAVWVQAEANGTFGAFVRLLLLTGQRREKVASMKWEDVSVDGIWTIPTVDREKGNAKEVVLPDAALAIIKGQPHFAENSYIFAGRGGSHFSGYSKSKAAFDAKLTSFVSKEVTPWTLHDLRRTARSLMARAGVSPDHAERTVGHVLRGVEGIYNRHSYRDEKGHALAALASLIESIVHPQDNVVAIKAR